MPAPVFTFYSPCNLLRPYIRYYWVARGCGSYDTLTFPIGCTQILFHRATRFIIPELCVTQDRLTVSGQVCFPSHVAADGDVDTIAVVFRPHAIGLFLGMPPDHLYNMEVDGCALGNSGLNRLAEEVFSLADADRCIRLVERWLLEAVDGADYAHCRRIGLAVKLLMADPQMTVSALADKTCLGVRQFNRQFIHHVGMSPKEYAGVVRFQKALWLMQRGCHNLADIAAEAGYSDQSHLTRECRRFSGLTPLSLLSSGAVYSDLFTTPA